VIDYNFKTSIPSIDSYTSDEIEGFLKYSSAGKIYFDLIKIPSLDSIYRFRHRAWLEVALANFHSKSIQKERSLHWSKSMDQIVDSVFKLYFSNEDPIIVIALGKFGSEVLNLSSDIDILLVTDSPPQNELLKKVRNFIQHLNAKTPDGFLTRVDLNLKPTDHPSPVVTASHLTSYLWQSSQLWERLVYTRARKISGQIDDEPSLFNEIKKFCFRKYIRLDLVVGLSSLIQKIMNNNQDDNNIKLCPGGIRSIELMVSALQLLYGGRSIELQTSYTYDILSLLDRFHIFSINQIAALQKNYDILRTTEDRLQSKLDEQTHSLSNAENLATLFEENQKIVSTFLLTIEKNPSNNSSSIFDQLQELSKTHFHLNEFIQFLNKNPSYIRLFETHPKIFENLLNSLIYSPQVTKLILLRPDLLDMFLVKKTFIDSNDSDEDFLINLSDFKSISQITAIGEFLTEYDLNKLLLKNSKTANLCVELLLGRIFNNESIDILKLGKWSANELGIFSDLDFVFVYDGNEELSRKARKFISYLTHGTFHGPFYNIDLRLRPSGNAGPILTSNKKLVTFLEKDASIWLRQAYLRNHFLKSNERLNFSLPEIKSDEKNELFDIRIKRFVKINPSKVLLKDNLGGIVDIEFFIQCLFLNSNRIPKTDTLDDQIQELIKNKLIDETIGSTIRTNYQTFRFLEQMSEIFYKSSQINEQDFNKILQLKNIESKLAGLTSFKDLIDSLEFTKNLIEDLHPFKSI
jgi:[glutamine synthetase] adenylyltransferase / [glutamine synthetase]-adenylyl-L-tyrosine phosphorylase